MEVCCHVDFNDELEVVKYSEFGNATMYITGKNIGYYVFDSTYRVDMDVDKYAYIAVGNGWNRETKCAAKKNDTIIKAKWWAEYKEVAANFKDPPPYKWGAYDIDFS